MADLRGVGAHGVGVVGVEGGVARVLALPRAQLYRAARPGPELRPALPLAAARPRLGLLGELGQGGALVRVVTVCRGTVSACIKYLLYLEYLEYLEYLLCLVSPVVSTISSIY